MNNLTEEKLVLMNLPYRYWDAVWQDLDSGLQTVIQNYIETWQDNRADMNLLFYGKMGSGKTYAMAVIAKVLRSKGLTCHWVSGADFVRTPFSEGRKIDERRCLSVNVLFIDGLINDIDELLLYSILKQRLDNMLPTIYTLDAEDASKWLAGCSHSVWKLIDTYSVLVPVQGKGILKTRVERTAYILGTKKKKK